MRQSPKKFSRRKNVLEVLYHDAKLGGGGSDAAKNVEIFVYPLPERCWCTPGGAGCST